MAWRVDVRQFGARYGEVRHGENLWYRYGELT